MSAGARAAVRVLRTGTVPAVEARSLSIGAERFEQAMQRAVRTFKADGTPRPLFIKGEWGTGKTHCLQLIQALAHEAGCAVTGAVLNSRAAAINYPQRLIPRFARQVRLGANEGLRAIVRETVATPGGRKRLAALPWSRSTDDVWSALRSIRSLFENGEAVLAEGHVAWRMLEGADIASSDYGYRRDKAMARFGWLTSLMAECGALGTVLLLDELETIDQLYNRRSRAVAYDVLGRFCELKRVWCVMGVTERFTRTIDQDLDGGIEAIVGPAGSRFLQHWRKGTVQLVNPPEVGDEEGRTLAQAVGHLYGRAYPEASDCAAILDQYVQEWQKNPSRNPRRLVRLLLHGLDAERPLKYAGT